MSCFIVGRIYFLLAFLGLAARCWATGASASVDNDGSIQDVITTTATPGPVATNICLNMIVKDEVKVLPRLFSSVKDYIDYYVIVDTGSTDETIALIRREMEQYGLPGEVHEREWKNFGFNRQQALELAVQADKCEWVLFVDADEELGVSDPKFYEKLEPGVSYNIEKHHSGERYAVPQLININANEWRWEGPVHEYIVRVAGPERSETRHDVWIIYHSGEGARSHGVSQEEKYLRDAKILEEYLMEHPGDPRSQFYLGQSYKDAGHFEKAYEAYQKRVELGGWIQERFMAQLNTGQMAILLKMPESVILQHFLDAYEMRPTRAEALHALARYYRESGQPQKAHLFAKTGVDIQRPDDILFVAQWVYDWGMLDEYCVSAYWAGDYDSAEWACETILDRVEKGVVTLSESSVARVQKNLDFAKNKLQSA